MQTGRGILRRFFERHKEKQKPFQKEKHFIFNYGMVEGIDVFMQGVWDRIDATKDNKLIITDYKTNKESPEKDTFLLHRYPQFTIYSKAFRKLYGQEEDFVLFYHLRSGKLFKTKRSSEDFSYLDELVNESIRKIIMIRNEKATPFYGYSCPRCDYKPKCENLWVSAGPHYKTEDFKIKATIPDTWAEWDEE